MTIPTRCLNISQTEVKLMENKKMNPSKIYSLVPSAIKSLFGFAPSGTYEITVSGPRGTALKGIAENFVTVGTIMTEGKVAPEYAEIALSKLHEAQQAVKFAVLQGWNNGTPSQY